jgi:hypothetical protein
VGGAPTNSPQQFTKDLVRPSWGFHSALDVVRLELASTFHSNLVKGLSYKCLAPIPEFLPLPTFPASDAVAEYTEGTYPVAPGRDAGADPALDRMKPAVLRLSNGGTVGGQSDYVSMPGNVTFQFDGTNLD